MTETSTITLTCAGCGTEIYRKQAGGRPPTRCDACKKAYVKACNRTAYLKSREGVAVATDFTCADCRQVFPRTRYRGRAEFLCPGCRDARHKVTKANDNKRTALIRQARFETDGRWRACEGCGGRLQCGRVGRPYRWCPPCWLAVRKVREYEPRSLWVPYRCLDCPTMIKPGYHKRGKLRCTPCRARREKVVTLAWIQANKELYLEIQRAAGHRRRARLRGVGYEFFKNREIFDRDGWRCGICRRRISRRLRYPNPMAVSLDHKVPVVKGGPHSRSNTQASHAHCNNRKRARVAPIGEQIPLPI